MLMLCREALTSARLYAVITRFPFMVIFVNERMDINKNQNKCLTQAN